MVFETERLFLRPWKKEDDNRVYELAKDPHVGPPCGWTPHKNLKESKAVLRDILINDYTFALVLKDTQEVVGNISIMPYSESRFAQNDKQAEVGFWLGYPYWGKGYMAEACTRIITYGMEELKLEKIWCAHEVKNHNSMRVQQKCGFIFDHDETVSSKGEAYLLKVNYVKQNERG